MNKVILNWIKAEVESNGFRVAGPKDNILKVRIPGPHSAQGRARPMIMIKKDRVIVGCNWMGYCHRGHHDIPLARPDCLKQVICYLHQCRVHCINPRN